MTASKRDRSAALADLNHIVSLALLSIPAEHHRDAISQARRDLLALGVTVPELDAHGIKHDDAPKLRSVGPDTAPHCRAHLQFRSDCPACVSERDASDHV